MPTFAGDDWKGVTEMNIEARKMILDNVNKKEGFPNEYYPFLLPAIPQFRMTRRLTGDFELDDAEPHIMYEDAIGLTGDWRNSGPVFSLPYRCLTACKTPNLLAAGRCISVTDSMWDITRAIPVCAVTGEAAGTAAAIAVSDHTGVRDIAIKKLQQRLKKQGVLFKLPSENG